MSFSSFCRTAFALIVCVTLVTAVGCKPPKEKRPAPGVTAPEETMTPDDGTTTEEGATTSSETAESEESQPEEKPAEEPKPAEPMAEEKPAEKPAEAPKPEEKPAAEPKPEAKPAEAPKPEAKPAEAPKPEAKPAEAPKPEEKPAAAPKPEEKKPEEPKPEEKPAAEPKPEAKPAAEPKPEAKPAEPKPEAKPAAEPKPEAKSAAEPKPEAKKPAETPKPEAKPAPKPEAKPEAKPAAADGPKGAKVELLMELPETCNTPDGMCLLPDNSILLSCPNVNDQSFPPVIMRIMPDNKLVKWIDPPKHPKTGKAFPFGICVDAEGKNVYVADLQWFADTKNPGNNSRIIQIPVDEKYNPAGEPKVIAEGAVVANAVVARDGIIYFTDTSMVPGTDPLITGVFRIPLSEAAKGPVQLKKPLEKEPHLIATIPTANVAIGFGADGLTFDDDGNMYVANFADGRIDKVTFDKDGKPSEPALFAKDPVMKCCDGIFYDKKRKKIFVADSLANAVQVVDMDGKVTTLASDGNNTGAGGRLDQPCEVLIRDDAVIVSNMDFPIPTGVNTTFDKPYTLSIIKLEE